MIRDPSYGSVREKPAAEAEAPPSPLRLALLAGKFKPEKMNPEYPFQRGWNDALDFALRKQAELEAKPANPESVIRRTGEQGDGE